jgi:hypothetical protein
MQKYLSAGKYTIEVTIKNYNDGRSTPIPDFTARVYAKDKVVITDAQGKTSQDETIHFRNGGSTVIKKDEEE